MVGAIPFQNSNSTRHNNDGPTNVGTDSYGMDGMRRSDQRTAARNDRTKNDRLFGLSEQRRLVDRNAIREVTLSTGRRRIFKIPRPTVLRTINGEFLRK
jgi:hypothetical protein